MTSNRALIWLHSATLIAFLAASSVPSPLYRLYQDAFGFSPLVLTSIFAIYPLALLASLILLGPISDHVGRRPVILGAIGLELAAMALFLLASGAEWLIAARVVQGVATGIAAATVGATLIDIDRDAGGFANSVAPMTGMGIGALASALLVRYAPAPLHLGFVVLVAIFLLQIARTARAPETLGERAPGRHRIRFRIVVPPRARPALIAVAPILIAIWALGGYYLSLMPSLITEFAGEDAAWIGGAAVFALTMTGAVSVIAMRNQPARTALATGTGALAFGVAAVVLSIDIANPVLLLLGSMLAGVGFGVGFLGAIRSVMPLAAPDERAGLMSAFYVLCYLANALPVLAAGYATSRFGLVPTANGFAAGIVLLAVLGGIGLFRRP